MSPKNAIKILIILALVIIISFAIIYKIRKDFNITTFSGENTIKKITTEDVKDEVKKEVEKSEEVLETEEQERREVADKEIEETIKELTKKDKENGANMTDETARAIEDMIKEEMIKRGQLD